jgi:hypothetical protein
MQPVRYIIYVFISYIRASSLQIIRNFEKSVSKYHMNTCRSDVWTEVKLTSQQLDFNKQKERE